MFYSKNSIYLALQLCVSFIIEPSKQLTLIIMPPKKIAWGDIPNVSKVMKKDVNGKWIHCKTCNITIKILSQFSFLEWNMHTNGIKHNELANSKALKNTPKLTTFFKKRKDNTNFSPKKLRHLRNDLKSSSVQASTMAITLTFFLFMLNIIKMMKRLNQ